MPKEECGTIRLGKRNRLRGVWGIGDGFVGVVGVV